MDGLVYALIQIVHNIGAVAVVGFSTYGLVERQATVLQRRIVLLIGLGWLIQAISGPAFGIATYSFYGEFPDIHGIAVGALIIKIICLLSGLFLIARAILKRDNTSGQNLPRGLFARQFALSVTALSAAAFLRWYS